MNSTVKHYPRNAYLRMHRKSACVETFKSIYEKWLPTRAILGHKHGDITTKVYTHKELRELRKAIELLP